MPMENNWDFDCTLKINPELLTAYNETNHADFELLPDNCYTLAEKVSFVSGKSTSIATVKINIPDDLKFGKYMLPIELSECSMPTFDIKEGTNTYLAGIVYQKHIDITELEEIKLTESMISSNARTEDFESLDPRTQLVNIIDGDIIPPSIRIGHFMVILVISRNSHIYRLNCLMCIVVLNLAISLEPPLMVLTMVMQIRKSSIFIQVRME